MKKLLESLNQEMSSQVEFRRYNLSAMLSESYNMLYKAQEGTNFRKLVENHLTDLKQNPKEIDRLSHNLCILKGLHALTESGKLSDEELVAKECHDTVEPKEERVLQESKLDRQWSNEWQRERGKIEQFKYYSTTADILSDDTIGVIIRSGDDDDDESATFGVEIYDQTEMLTIAGFNEEFKSEEDAKSWVENWFNTQIEESVTDELKDDISTEDLKEVDDPELTEEELEELSKHLQDIRKAKKNIPAKEDVEESKEEDIDEAAEGRVCQVGVDIYFPTDVETRATESKIAEVLQNAGFDVVGCMFSDTSWSREEYGLSENRTQEVSEAKSYSGLENFKKHSEGKAFYKTFKRLDPALKEGRELTIQESIDLYKAANSAMTQLSIELEHNPEFLETFKECTTLLSADISKLLESMTESRTPDEDTLKSIAKFSEALLKEDEEEEENIEDEAPEDQIPEKGDFDEFVGSEEGDIDHEPSEEEEKYDDEYADGRKELHQELADEFEETEDEFVQDKIEQDAAEVAELTGEDPSEVAEEESEEETPEEEEEDDSDITEDELEELKKHLREMRTAKRLKEATEAELLQKVAQALEDAKIPYAIRNRGMILVAKSDLDRASEIRNEIDPEYIITVASRA